MFTLMELIRYNMANDKKEYDKYILIVVGVLTILSGVGTFFGTLDPLLQDWGVAGLAVLLGVMKLGIGALLLWEKTRLLGALAAISYYGGAIATHVAFDSFNVQFGVVILITIALWVAVLSRVQGPKQMA